jgi:hypothetical protein
MKLKDDFGIWWNMKKYKKKDIPAREFGNKEILEVNAINDGWPGPETDVKYWVVLENDKAVGFREPKHGKAEFPVYDIKNLY